MVSLLYSLYIVQTTFYNDTLKQKKHLFPVKIHNMLDAKFGIFSMKEILMQSLEWMLFNIFGPHFVCAYRLEVFVIFVSVVFSDSPWQTESLSLHTWFIFIPGNYICLVSKGCNRTLIRWPKWKAAVWNHSSMTKNTLCHHYMKLISSVSQSQTKWHTYLKNHWLKVRILFLLDLDDISRNFCISQNNIIMSYHVEGQK